MASQPDPGPVLEGQPGDRLPAPGRWRRKTAEVEAIQWTGGNLEAVRAFAGAGHVEPRHAGTLHVLTYGGWKAIWPGAWIGREDGELFCCAETTFAHSYEPAGDAPDDDRSAPAGAQHAIGNVIRHAESVLLEEHPDARELARVLLEICGQWTGGLRASDIGAAMIAAERARQVAVEGYTPEHDAEHVKGELARAAAVYALRAVNAGGVNPYDPMRWWPQDWVFKGARPGGDPVADLVKAGGLIAAEIDRIVALAAKGSGEEGADRAER